MGDTMADLFTKGKLRRTDYAILQTGAVRPLGWLKDQLMLQRDGFFEDMEVYPHYGSESAWKGGSGENWENGPYYLRGLIILAYVLDDCKLKERASVWIEAILASQRESGMFGPTSNEDWWSRMPVLMALRDYYEATEREGSADQRIPIFMEKYFRYQLKMLPEKPLESWAKARGGDNIDSVLWLYNRLYTKEKPGKYEWLLDLAELLRVQTDDWVRLMNETTVRTHVVNTSQAMKTPALNYLLSGDPVDRDALKNGLAHIAIDHGRIDGLPNSDEAARDNLSVRGSELCGIVEGMLSAEIAFSILGDPDLCDRLETLAYNALPAAYAPDYSGHVYFILQNQVLATVGYHEFDCDHGDSSAFAAPCGYDCCFANNHMGWGKFVKSMWMAYRNQENLQGLAVVAYGPCEVEAEVADGKIARFTEETSYPFDDRILLTYHGEDAFFPISLPLPKWCVQPEIRLNGTRCALNPTEGRFFSYTGSWKDGDQLEIRLPMEIRFTEGYNRSVAVSRGPLIYSLKILEEWREYSDDQSRELKVHAFGCVKKQEVYPASRWNYALLADANRMEVEMHPMTRQPFDSTHPPISLHAVGQIVPEWKLDGNHAGVQPFGGIFHDRASECAIELIPYGAARLKITHFPRICENPSSSLYWDAPIRSVTRKSGEQGDEYRTTDLFSCVTLPVAEDYELIVYPQDEGKNRSYLQINGVDVPLTNGRAEHLASISPYCSFGYYNSFLFEGDPIRAMEILPIHPFAQISANRIVTRPYGITVEVNTTRESYGYELDFGLDSDDLRYKYRGFKSEKARIGGLLPNMDYYFRLSTMIDGKRVRSEVYRAHTDSLQAVSESMSSYSGELHPDAFTEYGDPVSEYSSGMLSVGASRNYKALLKNAEEWENYEVTAKICLRNLTGDAGLIFCVTEATSGADAYNGYYFGLREGGALIGSTQSGHWRELASADLEVKADEAYVLSVRVCRGHLLCELDHHPIFSLFCEEHWKGSVGFRTYGAPFAADSIRVRPLTTEEMTQIGGSGSFAEVQKFGVTWQTAFETIQLRYPKIQGASFYQIDYGTSSGFYPNTITDIRFNPYKGSEPFLADQTAFTFTGTTCYLRMSAWQGDRKIAETDEIEILKSVSNEA